MIEVSALEPPIVRLLNINAISEVAPTGPNTCLILMRDGRVHHVTLSYEDIRRRLGMAHRNIRPVVLLDVPSDEAFS